jgi:hypothetical protein
MTSLNRRGATSAGATAGAASSSMAVTGCGGVGRDSRPRWAFHRAARWRRRAAGAPRTRCAAERRDDADREPDHERPPLAAGLRPALSATTSRRGGRRRDPPVRPTSRAPRRSPESPDAPRRRHAVAGLLRRHRRHRRGRRHGHGRLRRLLLARRVRQRLQHLVGDAPAVRQESADVLEHLLRRLVPLRGIVAHRLVRDGGDLRRDPGRALLHGCACWEQIEMMSSPRAVRCWNGVLPQSAW